jgi:prepilin-type N-terminal cleavage/methylation domain-containing protein
MGFKFACILIVDGFNHYYCFTGILHMWQIKMKKAFTLIELSISMLILGLLISGVLVANKMQKSAKRNKIIKEKDQLEQAIIDFKVQYGSLPGSTKIYNQIQDYPELLKGNGGTTSYWNQFSAYSYSVQFPEDVFFDSWNGAMSQSGMLQMRNSSGGSYPSISSNSSIAWAIPLDQKFQKSSVYNAVLTYGKKVSTNNGPTEDFRLLNIGTTPVSQLPSFITNFLNNHVIIMSGISSVYVGRIGFASMSTSDAVALSKKYDNGKPYGEKISFGRGSDTTSGRCVTATTWNYGTTATTIGPNTKFSTFSPDSINCSVMFLARFNEM